MENTFVPVAGYEGVYEINRHGVVRSVLRVIHRSNGTIQTFKQHVLSQFLSEHGYPCVRLRNSSKRKSCVARVHRLLAIAFIDNSADLPEVNHIDGDKGNYGLDNLEWVTSQGNRQHAWRIGLRNRSHLPYVCGEMVGNAKLTDAMVIDARQMRASGMSYSKIGAAVGVTKRTVMRAIKGESWKHIPPTPE